MAKTDLTAQRLRELLHYDPETGIFRWRASPGNGIRYAGDVAGWITGGYVNIEIGRVRHKAHRLAWLYVYGDHPTKFLDHINHVRSDNRICNLRQVNYAENIQNRRPAKDNTSGVKGVHWDVRCSKWRAQIRHEGKQFHLGLFTEIADAASAYAIAAAKYHTCNPSSQQAQQPAR